MSAPPRMGSVALVLAAPAEGLRRRVAFVDVARAGVEQFTGALCDQLQDVLEHEGRADGAAGVEQARDPARLLLTPRALSTSSRLRSFTCSSRKRFSSAPATICPALVMKSRYSAKSRSRSSKTSMIPIRRSPASSGMHSSLTNPQRAKTARSAGVQPRVVGVGDDEHLAGAARAVRRAGTPRCRGPCPANPRRSPGLDGSWLGSCSVPRIVGEVDLAVGRIDGECESAGDLSQEVLDVGGLRRQRAEVDESPEDLAPALSQPVEESLLHRAADHLGGALHEVRGTGRNRAGGHRRSR